MSFLDELIPPETRKRIIWTIMALAAIACAIYGIILAWQ